MKKLTFTKKQAVRLHRELWNWLADNPDSFKYDWPGWNKDCYAINYCFLCQYAIEKREQMSEEPARGFCSWCPADWGVDRCEDLGSYFISWKFENYGSKERSDYARQIANIKIKKVK